VLAQLQKLRQEASHLPVERHQERSPRIDAAAQETASSQGQNLTNAQSQQQQEGEKANTGVFFQLAQAECATPQRVGPTGPSAHSSQEIKGKILEDGHVGPWMGGGGLGGNWSLEHKLERLRLLKEEGEAMLIAAGH